jgi:acyl-CoA thioester hydrolase
MLILEYEYVIKPRFSDTDSYGVMHHSSYFKWFEEARFEFSKEVLKFDEDLLNGKKLKFPIVECNCRFKESVIYDDVVKIDLKFLLGKSAKITFEYKAINLRINRICAVGKNVHMFLDENNRICLNIPKVLSERLDATVKFEE